MTAFLKAYIECALWSSHTEPEDDDTGGPTFEDDNYDADDIAPEALASMEKDCEAFQTQGKADLEFSGLTEERAGHNFWLNRNGHGAGFWDSYSQTTCERYNVEQSIAMQTRDFSARDNLKTQCNCPYHACQRLSDLSKTFGSSDLYLGDSKKVYVL